MFKFDYSASAVFTSYFTLFAFFLVVVFFFFADFFVAIFFVFFGYFLLFLTIFAAIGDGLLSANRLPLLFSVDSI